MTECAVDIAEINRLVSELRDGLEPLYRELENVIVGQRVMIDRLLVGLLTGGHILLEGVPGSGQDAGRPHPGPGPAPELPAAFSSRPTCCRPTSSARRSTTRAPASSASARGRSSPTWSWPTKSTAPPPRCRAPCSRRCRKSRSPSATPAIVLEQPFLVLATQNPIEQEGTYPLPEAQVDRFMLKLQASPIRARRKNWPFWTGWPRSSRT